MSRSCLIEESIKEHVSRLQNSRTEVEVGLVLGRLAVGNRDMLLALARTPDGEEGPNTVGSGGVKHKGASAQPILMQDVEWLEEHCRQVSSMLPGGIDVVGVYVFAPEVTYKSQLASLAAAVRAVAAVVGELRLPPAQHHSDVMLAAGSSLADTPAAAGSSSSSSEPHLLLHVDPKTSKYSVRHCQPPGGGRTGGDGTHPAEYKFGRPGRDFYHVQSSLQLDTQLQVTAAKQSGSGSSGLLPHFTAALNRFSHSLAGSEVVYCGQLLGSDPVSTIFQSSTDTHMVHLCTPLQSTRLPGENIATPTEKTSKGMVRVRGVVAVHCYVHRSEAAGPRVRAMACQDAHASLRARLRLLQDEADREDEEREGTPPEEEGPSQGPSHPLSSSADIPAILLEVPLPIRVELPWLDGICLYDHLMPGETVKDAQARVQELLGGSPASSTSEELGEKAVVLEGLPITVSTKIHNGSASNCVYSEGKALDNKTAASAGICSQFSLISLASLAAAGVACIAYYVL